MTKWLHSGRRRDLCALLYDAGELRAQSLKNRLESHYDERIDPGSFYATLNSLVESGHLDRHTEGIADVYALSDTGERALRDHYDWLSALLAEKSLEEDDSEGGNEADEDTDADDGPTDIARSNLKD